MQSVENLSVTPKEELLNKIKQSKPDIVSPQPSGY